MGVHGLWELLAPVGRRVSVETLAGKKLAIDASIWMVQFMKAMRDERGDMVRNAHLIGFFRRICKLLFLRTKPVFVFDGGTPALKRRTVIARRRQRENAQAKIRKTAEKLLLNQLKAMRLKELANDIENQRQKNSVKGKNVVLADSIENNFKTDDDDKVTKGYDQETLDELLAASLAAEEDGSFNTNVSSTVGGVGFEEEEDDDDDEEMVLTDVHGKVDPSVLASLPPSMQLDLLVQMRERLMAENRQKYQKVKQAPAKFSELQIQSYLKTVAFRREINEVQKAAAGKGVGGVQTSRIASEANREFIFSSSFTGDKEILATAGVEKNGEVERQALRKEPASSGSVSRVSSIAQTSSAGSAINELTRDSQALRKEPASSGSVSRVSSIAQTSSAGSAINELTRDSHDDVETFLDERGRVRVSRVRAMGIRMTRDLQRNLDLIKEIEHDKVTQISSSNLESSINADLVERLERCPENVRLPEAPDKKNDEIINLDDANLLVQNEYQKIYKQLIVENNTSLEISFIEDANRCGGTNDDVDFFFAQLVAGNSAMVSSAENVSSGKPSCATASDCIWKIGINEEKDDIFGHGSGEETQSPLAKENSDESEVEWEEGDFHVPKDASPCPTELQNAVTRGSLEEEADIQEAIRRSLEDSSKEKSNITSFVNENTGSSREVVNRDTSIEFSWQTSTAAKDKVHFLNLAREAEPLQCQISVKDMAGHENLNQVGHIDILQINDSPERQLTSSIELRTKIDEKAEPLDKSCVGYPVSSVQVSNEETSEYATVHMGTPCMDPVNPSAPSKVHSNADGCLDMSNEAGMVTSLTGPNGASQISAAVMTDRPKVIVVDTNRDNSEALPTCHSYGTNDNANSQVKSSTDEVAPNNEIEQNIFAERNLEHKSNNSSIQDTMMGLTSASLDEELLNLRQEHIDLGEEQRKNERNAESVSSEMFAECQELLQMFGIPYIIAPMEAEAQCAYMELANLVDGVVTDDSDVFLFGAQSVYKNIFDERKYVETYFMKDIESELGLTREQLIRMALLLGSDYTEGVSGIGIVNAIEVVHAFPEEDGLQKFREWLESPDPTILGKFGSQSGPSSRKRGSKISSSDADCMKNDVGGDMSVDKSISQGPDAVGPVDEIPKIKQIFMDKHRNVSKNWHISSSFPSETVICAYVSPQVDKSTEPFSWGKPDLFVLRKLCWEKFGWSNQKADDLLLPVLKEYNKRETQLRLEAFYTFNERFAKIRSRRIKKAVKGITGNRPSEFMDDLPKENSKSRRKGTGPSKPVEKQSENSPDTDKDSLAENKSSAPDESTSIQSRKRIECEPMMSEVRKEGRHNSKRGLGGKVRGSGRGRGRGRGRGTGRGKESFQYQSTETSCTDGSDDNVLEMQEKTTESSSKVRRSTRARKQVKYTANDAEAEPENEQERSHGEGMLKGTAYELNEGRSSILNNVVHGDHFEMGGGFCMDEAENEPNKLVFNLTKVCDLDTDDPCLRDDYLNTGGGFCMDEGEPDSNTVQSVSSPIQDSNELRDIGKRKLDTSLNIQTSSNIQGNVDAANVDSMLPEEADTAPISATTGLSAMPLLRRKRRKA